VDNPSEEIAEKRQQPWQIADKSVENRSREDKP
jgi:hypothetical protein